MSTLESTQHLDFLVGKLGNIEVYKAAIVFYTFTVHLRNFVICCRYYMYQNVFDFFQHKKQTTTETTRPTIPEDM